MADTVSTPQPESPRSANYSFLFRWLHWLLIPSTVVLILTGLSLHAGSRPEWSLTGGKIPSWFWTGRVHYWHAWAGLVFVPSILAACWSYLRSRVNFRPTHLVLLLGGAALVASGILLANPPSSDFVYRAALLSHTVLGLVVAPVWFLWHLVTGLTKYWKMLIPAFHPWAAPRGLPVVGFLLFSAVTSCLLTNGWPMRFPWRDLVAVKIDRAEVKDLTSLPWDRARPLAIQLASGANLDAGRTCVTFRALHDGDELFVEASWADKQADYNIRPWKKTAGGWESVKTSDKDECHYYEDKFSLFFPIQPQGDFERFGCAASCHLDSAFGWGYKGSAYRLDTWHWKAARTDTVGRVDDQYCSEVDFTQKDVGRHGDPNQGGGYSPNRKGKTDQPAFLPAKPGELFRGAILKSQGVPYSEAAAAAIPTGTFVPGVVVEPFRGDRGDVLCQSEHRQGCWTLWIRRKLSTGSECDTQFAPGGRYAFGCAAFDHAGKRHAYALPTFHLELAQ